jgi:pheromone shutdown protein TraB
MIMPSEIYNMEYNDFVDLLGTAHFTRRSIEEARRAVETTGTKDLAIELDLRRFSLLNGRCSTCAKRGICTTKCEFIVASDALGNVDANIWLIDMSEEEMRRRVWRLHNSWAHHRSFYPFHEAGDNDVPWLWEKGFKEEATRRSMDNLERLRTVAPNICRVLIEERNAIMAARLAWIATKRMDEGEKPNILALVGAAHVQGIKRLLENPKTIRESLQALSLPYSPPTLIRRISVRNN